MSKVLNFSEIASDIAFPEFNFHDLYRSMFEKSELGWIKEIARLEIISPCYVNQTITV